jgi:hypothetical protein
MASEKGFSLSNLPLNSYNLQKATVVSRSGRNNFSLYLLPFLASSNAFQGFSLTGL